MQNNIPFLTRRLKNVGALFKVYLGLVNGSHHILAVCQIPNSHTHLHFIWNLCCLGFWMGCCWVCWQAGTGSYIPGIPGLWISTAVQSLKRMHCCPLTYQSWWQGWQLPSDTDFSTALWAYRRKPIICVIDLGVTHQLNTVLKGVIQGCHSVVVIWFSWHTAKTSSNHRVCLCCCVSPHIT